MKLNNFFPVLPIKLNKTFDAELLARLKRSADEKNFMQLFNNGFERPIIEQFYNLGLLNFCIRDFNQNPISLSVPLPVVKSKTYDHIGFRSLKKRLCKNVPAKDRIYSRVCKDCFAEGNKIHIEFVDEAHKIPRKFLMTCGSNYCSDGLSEYKKRGKVLRKAKSDLHNNLISKSDFKSVVKSNPLRDAKCVGQRILVNKAYFTVLFNVRKVWFKNNKWLHSSLGFSPVNIKDLNKNFIKNCFLNVKSFLNDWKKLYPDLTAIGEFDLSIDKNNKAYVHYHLATRFFKNMNNEKLLNDLINLGKSNNLVFHKIGVRKASSLINYFAKRKAGIYHLKNQENSIFCIDKYLSLKEFCKVFYNLRCNVIKFNLFSCEADKLRFRELKEHFNRIFDNPLLSPIGEDILYNNDFIFDCCPVCRGNRFILVNDPGIVEVFEPPDVVRCCF